jgi:hypothetical protein
MVAQHTAFGAMMEYTSLPTYPPPLPSQTDGHRRNCAWRPTQRQKQVLVDLAWLGGIVALLLWLLQTTEAIKRPTPTPPQPLSFELIALRFDRVGVGMSSEEVFALLGPQQFVELDEPEFEEINRRVAARPDRFPGQWFWAKWADPANPKRWVAVFIAGSTVHYRLKRGIGR